MVPSRGDDNVANDNDYARDMPLITLDSHLPLPLSVSLSLCLSRLDYEIFAKALVKLIVSSSWSDVDGRRLVFTSLSSNLGDVFARNGFVAPHRHRRN